MLFSLVKKDFILAKKYLIFMLIFAGAGPIFIITKLGPSGIGSSGSGFLGFLLTVLYMEYILFGTVSILEDKYKGSALLCTTPYTRNALVKAKYLFILVIFICSYIIYTITAFLVPIRMDRLNFFTLGISLLIITIYFGIIIPLQYKFGYEKTKYISFTIIFISPFVVPNIVKWLHSNNISLQITIPFPQVIQNLIPCVIALIIGFISMTLSIHIYSKKNL